MKYRQGCNYNFNIIKIDSFKIGLQPWKTFLYLVIAAVAYKARPDAPQVHFLVRIKLCQPRTCNKCVKLLIDNNFENGNVSWFFTNKNIDSRRLEVLTKNFVLRYGCKMIKFRDEKRHSKCVLLYQKWLTAVRNICLITVVYSEIFRILKILRVENKL